MAKGIAVSPLTGRVQYGAISKDGSHFTGNAEDVTSDFLRAVIEKSEYHGGRFDIEVGSQKWVVTVLEIVN